MRQHFSRVKDGCPCRGPAARRWSCEARNLFLQTSKKEDFALWATSLFSWTEAGHGPAPSLRLLYFYIPVAGVSACQSQPSPWTNSAQRRRITSTYFGSNSIVQLTRFVCSQAISVLPDPPNRSSTVSPAFEELKIALIASAVGFCVGCTYSRVLSRLMSQTVVWQRSPNHSQFSPS